VFVPGGVLGALGCVIVAVAIGGAFVSHGVILGGWLLCGSVVVGFVGFNLWMKYFPRSRIGKKAILQEDAGEWHAYRDSKATLVEQTGLAHTPLHPGGIAIIGGKRIDVVTRGEMLKRKTRIKVIKVEGNRVVVTATESLEGE